MSWYRDDDGKIITDEEFGSDCGECSIFCQEGRITIPCNGERTDCPYFKEVDTSEYDKKIYNKAIDDLTEKIVGYGTYDYYGNVIDVLEIAEKLKEHKTLNIVHCKDCKHWGTGIAGETENVKCCSYGKYMVGANGYCVYGEKECAE